MIPTVVVVLLAPGRGLRSVCLSIGTALFHPTPVLLQVVGVLESHVDLMGIFSDPWGPVITSLLIHCFFLAIQRRPMDDRSVPSGREDNLLDAAFFEGPVQLFVRPA